MADGFDIVAVWVQHEGTIVVLVIMRARTRLAVVASTCCEGSFIELIHQLARRDPKRDVNTRLIWSSVANPKVRLRSFPKPGNVDATGDRQRQLHQQAVTDGFERVDVEALASFI